MLYSIDDSLTFTVVHRWFRSLSPLYPTGFVALSSECLLHSPIRRPPCVRTATSLSYFCELSPTQETLVSGCWCVSTRQCISSKYQIVKKKFHVRIAKDTAHRSSVASMRRERESSPTFQGAKVIAGNIYLPCGTPLATAAVAPVPLMMSTRILHI